MFVCVHALYVCVYEVGRKVCIHIQSISTYREHHGQASLQPEFAKQVWKLPC